MINAINQTHHVCILAIHHLSALMKEYALNQVLCLQRYKGTQLYYYFMATFILLHYTAFIRQP